MSNSFDIAVAYRIYPGVSKTPIIHPFDKLSLVRTCLLSFKEALSGLKASLFFILDGCPPQYEQLVNTIFDDNSITIINTPSIGNLETFRKQIEILLAQQVADYVYFAEDDYLYRPGTFKSLLNVVKDKKAEFVSPYLHKDIFTHPIHRHKRNIDYFQNNFWIEANSTCLTFLTAKKTLQETKGLFLTYCNNNNDCAIWLVLTKTHIFRPISYIRFMFNRECFGILKMAIKRSFKFFFSTRKYCLWVPYPSIATHLEKGLESPGIDWANLAKEIENKYNAW